MDHEAPFLMALGMLIAASLVVSISGWVLFARDRALHRAAVKTYAGSDGVHHGAADEE